MNMAAHLLSKDELIELLDIAVKEYPPFALKIKEAIKLSASKPPPKVDYESLLSEFNEHIHMLDHLRPSKQFNQIHLITDEIDPLIAQVAASVNRNSTREDLEKAFVCLLNFGNSMAEAEHEVQQQLVWGCGGEGSMHEVIEGMVEVGDLLREAGGPKDLSLKRRILALERECELEFGEIMDAVWGEEEEEEKNDDDETVSHPAKRARVE
jgi:hypothetical protein